MAKERVYVRKLEKADPIKFAELCEKAGYIDEAIRIYSNSNRSGELLYATELAFQERDYETTRQLIEKTRKSIIGRLHDSPPYGCRTSWGGQVAVPIGEAMSRDSQHEHAKRIDLALSKLEEKLSDIEVKT